jgi:hypothetical protein
VSSDRILKRNAVIAGIAGNGEYLAQKRWRDLLFYTDSSPVNAERLGKPLELATYRSEASSDRTAASSVESLSSNSDARSNEGQPAPRKQHQPRGSGVQFRECAILQYSKTPSLRSPGFEDDEEDSLSDVAFCTHLVGSSVRQRSRKDEAPDGRANGCAIDCSRLTFLRWPTMTIDTQPNKPKACRNRLRNGLHSLCVT